jgi:hypothetical protein
VVSLAIDGIFSEEWFKKLGMEELSQKVDGCRMYRLNGLVYLVKEVVENNIKKYEIHPVRKED